MKTIEIKSEISGSVCGVTASVGQRVEEGDVILLVESMKMEIPITAPCDGTITRISHASGDTVNEDETVALLDTP